jgi:hypothetical protein
VPEGIAPEGIAPNVPEELVGVAIVWLEEPENHVDRFTLEFPSSYVNVYEELMLYMRIVSLLTTISP